MTAHVECPSCGTPVEWSQQSPYRPFCSRRCKLIDLGDWLDESHRIAGPELDDEAVSELGFRNPQRPANEDEHD